MALADAAIVVIDRHSREQPQLTRRLRHRPARARPWRNASPSRRFGVAAALLYLYSPPRFNLSSQPARGHRVEKLGLDGV